jgi:inosine-uridine nucleoside N-ribohydrolase
MLGRFFDEGHWEWNGLVDPASTAIVLHQQIPGHLLVGLDVTLEVELPAAEVRSRFHGPLLSVVAQMAEAWFSHSEHLTFHDPLAAALLFQPGLCQTERGRSWGSWPDADGKGGQTFWAADPEGPHLACTTVDAPAFFSEYFSWFPPSTL